MSNPITNARHLLRRRDATAKHVGYMDRELAEAMRALLAEVDRMRAEDARCLDAIDAATRENERRHAEVVKAAMERERLLEAERDEALRRGRLEGAEAMQAASATMAFDQADRCDKYSLPGMACVRVGDAIRNTSPAAIVAALEK